MKTSTGSALFFALFGLLLLGLAFLINAGNNLVSSPLTQAATKETYDHLILPLYVIGAVSIIVAFLILLFWRKNNS